MSVDKKVIDETKYDVNREATKISALSLGKIDKCEYLWGRMWPSASS